MRLQESTNGITDKKKKDFTKKNVLFFKETLKKSIIIQYHLEIHIHERKTIKRFHVNVM